MGRPFRVLLSGPKVYACGACRTHLAGGQDLVSKHFHSRSGRAYLFSTTVNVVCGPHENRIMTTGKHIVCDLFCVECMSCVGWQYIFAHEPSQKYKEGSSVLERALVVDFEKTSDAAALARMSLSTTSSVSSGSPTALLSAGSGGALQLHHQPSHPSHPHLGHLQLVGGGGLALAYPHLQVAGLPLLLAHQGMDGGGQGTVMFAADDSGSEDEE